ncbi:MAG TPA: hypothetical protein VL200_10865 [Lacunisphaera sp.]|jgi:hypothetical protein|nr:hypothetical protein [Lacunisphaera sp.]
MNQIEGLLFVILVPLALLLNGYWLAATLPHASALERLAWSILGGLALLLAAVAAINFFVPLDGFWAWLCLLPMLATLVPRHLRALGRDLRALRSPAGAILALAFALVLTLLLWPILSHAQTLFYDGTSNHDSFFWVSGAEHLKRHTYMEPVVHSSVRPLANLAGALAGWTPAWGRMGAEGLLAVTSSIVGASPIKLYVYAVASLYLVWVASCYLALKTFVTEKPGLIAAVGLATLQPVFIFFYANSNLPNLIGGLMGATFVIAFERALRSLLQGESDGRGFLVLVAFAFHGLLCAYPEMAPFVLLSVAFLWIRRAFEHGRAALRPCLLVGGAVAVGLLINCATTVRAVHGFIASLSLARTEQNWANVFASLHPAAYLAALGSLCVPAAINLGPWLGWPLTLAVLLSLVYALRAARDRYGLCAIFAGSAVLLLYTVATDFAYGWQKTVQFSGVFVGMVMPAALFHGLAEGRAGGRGWQRRIIETAGLAVLVYFAFAVTMAFRETYIWSERKVISNDWFELRDQSRTAFKDAPILVEGGSFPMSFFHSMWSAYFLDESRIYFGARGTQGGGYLRPEAINEATQKIPRPAAILVGRNWAETIDAHSPRLLTGKEFVLLRQANRITAFKGVYPTRGVPESASRRMSLEITPAQPASLRFTLTPKPTAARTATAWQVRRETATGDTVSFAVEGPPPWRFEVPLVARQPQSVVLTLEGNGSAGESFPFTFSNLTVQPEPIPLSPVDGRIDFTRRTGWQDYELRGLRTPMAGQPVMAAPDEAALWFKPAPAQADVYLELAAEPRYAPGPRPPLPTEFLCNDVLLFQGFFAEPGVLRARIPREIWNRRPVATFKLRFPHPPPAAPELVLKVLTVQPAASPP